MSDTGIDAADASGSAWFNAEPIDTVSEPTVLLVEDDADIRELARTLLQLSGFCPTACATAEAALEQLREQHFDVVLTDYMLPNRTGGWLLQQAVQEGLMDGSTAMVLTAHPNPPDVNGFEVVLKPCDPDDLVTRLRQHLAVNARHPQGQENGDDSARSHDGNAATVQK